MQFRKLIKGELIALINTIYDVYELININNKCSVKCLFDPTAAKPGGGGHVTGIRPKIHPDGTKLYFSHGNEAPWFKILDLTTGLLLPNPAVLPSSKIHGLQISPDLTELSMTYAATPYYNRYNLSDLTLKAAPAVPPVGQSYNIAYSPNGNWVCVTHASSPYLSVYNCSDMSKINIASLPGTATMHADFSPDNQYLAVAGLASGSATVSLYKTSDWSKVTVYSQHNANVNDLRFSQNSSRLAVLYNSAANDMLKYLNVLNPNVVSSWVNTNMPPPYNSNTTVARGVSGRWLDNDIFAFLAGGAGTSYRTAQSMFFVYNFATNALLEACPITPGNQELYGADWYLDSSNIRRKLAGTVKGPAPTSASLARTVRAYDKYSGEPVGETISSAVDGSFTLYTYSSDPVIVISVGQGTEVTKLFDGVIPSAL